MRAGIYYPWHNIPSYSLFDQAVSIPYWATTAKLTFYEHSISLNVEPDGDTQYLQVLDLMGNWLGTLFVQNYWYPDGLWVYHEYDLSMFKGMAVKLQFGVSNDGWYGVTSMFVDDASLIVCPP